MSLFRAASLREAPFALLVVRVVAGLTMAAHGYQKVFQFGLSAMAETFGKMGVPLSPAAGPVVSLLELVGGLAVAFGLLSRVFSALLAIDMLGAALVVHLANGFFAPKGVELPLLLLGMFLAIAIGGGGALSLDAMFDSRTGESH
jgi:putative oxidoreductase